MSLAKFSFNSLPEDLILEVFLRLPMKSLLRCRCLSKGLRNSIDCPFFKKRYHIFHYSISDFAVMTIEPGRLHSMDFHLSSDNVDSWKEKEIRIPHNPNLDFIGCCNGIVCLMVSPEPESYVFLNPFNGTFQKVERSNTYPVSIEMYSIGFGYDHVTDDYKIVRMQGFTNGRVDHYIDVYSMRRDSWKQLTMVISSGCFPQLNAICIEGVIHWLWLNNMNVYCCIAAFDLETEAMRILPVPPYVGREKMSLNDLGGRLSVFVKSYDSTVIWVKEEYGVETSWAPVFDITSPFLNILYSPPMARFFCFGLHLGLWVCLISRDSSTEKIEIRKQQSMEDDETQSWVCVRSAIRLRCSLIAN